MIHDHWKALARLLGAPGAAEPPASKAKVKPAETVEEASAKSSAKEGGFSSKGTVALPGNVPPTVAATERSSDAPSLERVESSSSRRSSEIETSPLKEMVEASQTPTGSSWDELVEKLGVPSEGSQTRKQSTPAISSSTSASSPEQFASPQASGAGSRRASEQKEVAAKKSLGFGSGLTGEPLDSEEREPRREEVQNQSVFARTEIPEGSEASTVGDDLGLDIDWGTPRRREQGRRGAEGGREQRGGRREPRGRQGQERETAPPARGVSRTSDESVADADLQQEKAREIPGREGERDDRGAGRGQRRGQRQRMGEAGSEVDSPEIHDAAAARSRSVRSRKIDPFVEDTDEFASGLDLDFDSAESMAVEDETNEEDSTRRRRRRGRRRRGGARGAEGEGKDVQDIAAVESDEFGSLHAPEATFDDDHEDDEEVVDMRRSRRRRRRGSGEGVKERSTSEEPGQLAIDDDDVDSDVTYQPQRNVPTWLEAVDLLVVPNIESRKREPRRGSGGQGSGGSGAGSGNLGGGGRSRGKR